MIQCPECRKMIPDDSAYCDQCGKELKWCPECKRPKRGTECPVCGSDLVSGRKYLAMLGNGGPSPASSQPQPTLKPQVPPQPQSPEPQRPVQPQQPQAAPAPQPQAAPAPQPQAAPAPQATAVSASGPVQPTALVGNGWRLPLQEGNFGRSGGIWNELSTCQYVSGSHGSISKSGAGWMITDVGSTNGTFVNGQRLPAGSPFVLSKGMNVRIATLEFTVE